MARRLAYLAIQHAVPHPTDFYLDIGTREVQENVRHREDVLQVMSQLEGVRRFRDVLRSKGYAVNYTEYDGGHDFAEWKLTLPHALRWALPNEASTHGYTSPPL